MDNAETKAWLYRRTLAEAHGFGLKVINEHSSADKPWGAYIRIAEESLPAFFQAYWNGIDVPRPAPDLKLDPKILIVTPGARLSLQYHHRRGEHWRVMDGPVKVVMGHDATSLNDVIAFGGDVLRIPCGMWHRLVGLDAWGRIAELWEHTDATKASGEDDIVRVQDDYGR